MLKEINGDILIINKLFLFIIKINKYIANDIIYYFYTKLNDLEKKIKRIHINFQIYLYNRKEKQILKDLSYCRVYVYIVSKIHLTIYMDRNDLDNVIETETVKVFRETLGFTNNDAFNKFIEDQQKPIYIINQQDLTDYE